jgi:hypothetical protein
MDKIRSYDAWQTALSQSQAAGGRNTITSRDVSFQFMTDAEVAAVRDDAREAIGRERIDQEIPLWAKAPLDIVSGAFLGAAGAVRAGSRKELLQSAMVGAVGGTVSAIRDLANERSDSIVVMNGLETVAGSAERTLDHRSDSPIRGHGHPDDPEKNFNGTVGDEIDPASRNFYGERWWKTTEEHNRDVINGQMVTTKSNRGPDQGLLGHASGYFYVDPATGREMYVDPHSGQVIDYQVWLRSTTGDDWAAGLTESSADHKVIAAPHGGGFRFMREDKETGERSDDWSPSGASTRSTRANDFANGVAEDYFGGYEQAPLVLDGDGIELSVRSGAFFDVDGDGYLERTAWVAPDDAFVVIDQDADGGLGGGGDGRITASREVMLAQWTEAADTDLQALRTFDGAARGGNRDGHISPDDAIWSNLKVWRDADGDGEVDGGELRALGAHGISRITLSYDNGKGYGDTGDDVSVFGSTLLGTATIRQNGMERAGAVGDVALHYATKGFRMVEKGADREVEFEAGGKLRIRKMDGTGALPIVAQHEVTVDVSRASFRHGTWRSRSGPTFRGRCRSSGRRGALAERALRRSTKPRGTALARRHVRDARQPQLLDQPALERPVRPLDAALGLR